MKFVVHMIDPAGRSKVRSVYAENVKDAQSKAKRRYPSHEIGRISKNNKEIDGYLGAAKEWGI